MATKTTQNGTVKTSTTHLNDGDVLVVAMSESLEDIGTAQKVWQQITGQTIEIQEVAPRASQHRTVSGYYKFSLITQ
jgi:hypothetical protein